MFEGYVTSIVDNRVNNFPRIMTFIDEIVIVFILGKKFFLEK